MQYYENIDLSFMLQIHENIYMDENLNNMNYIISIFMNSSTIKTIFLFILWKLRYTENGTKMKNLISMLKKKINKKHEIPSPS